MLQFEHSEDRSLFCFLLAGGDYDRFEKEFTHNFDFRPAVVKRSEFRRLRNRILALLREKYSAVCQLRLHPDCSKTKIWVADHVIPLSTAELNKKLRRLPRVGTAKVARQSFGSNHLDNLILSCDKCNAFKKHRYFIFGVPFTFLPHEGRDGPLPPPPPPKTANETVAEKAKFAISWPNVVRIDHINRPHYRSTGRR
jgi:hypothetical protein